MRPFFHATLSAALLVSFGSSLAAQESLSSTPSATASAPQRGQIGARQQHGEPTAVQLKAVQRRRAAAHRRLQAKPSDVKSGQQPGLVARERLARMNGVHPAPARSADGARNAGRGRSARHPQIGSQAGPWSRTSDRTSPRAAHKMGPKQGAGKSRSKSPAKRSRRR